MKNECDGLIWPLCAIMVTSATKKGYFCMNSKKDDKSGEGHRNKINDIEEIRANYTGSFIFLFNSCFLQSCPIPVFWLTEPIEILLPLQK